MDFKSIEILSHNSFFSSKLIAHFLSGCENNSIRNEVIYLILPLVYYKDSREILKNANSSSTLNSLFLNAERGKIALAGLEKRIAHFKSPTQKSLVVAAKDFELQIGENITINKPIDYSNESEPYIKEYFKSANYLGKVLSKSGIFDAYIKLGIKDIWIATLNK
jgi:hypothetical protein